jgi:predicted PurR-regulated permease PerM
MTSNPRSSPDLTRTTLAVLFIGLLIAACLWILQPFIGATIWATMIVVATWPAMLRVQRRLWGRRSLAVLVMTLALLLLFVAPLTMAVGTIVGNVDTIAGWVHVVTAWELPATAPTWLAGLPVVGDMIASAWMQLMKAGLPGLLSRLTPYAGDLTRWFASQAGGVGFVLVQFLMTVAIAAVMYAGGEEAAGGVRRFARRLAGERGDGAVQLAAGAIRGVALGVGVTAIVQSVLGGLGLALAGVPFAGVLTAVMFILCIAQVGPILVLLPATVWLFYEGPSGWAIFMLVWTLVVGTLDNFLRPWLIRFGADLPLLLIFAGVIGGLLAFGLVGVFAGPVLLAVAYTLLASWIADGERNDASAPIVSPAEAAVDARDTSAG